MPPHMPAPPSNFALSSLWSPKKDAKDFYPLQEQSDQIKELNLHFNVVIISN